MSPETAINNAIGVVLTTSGEVQLKSVEGLRIAESGSQVFQGDELITGVDGQVEVRFADETILSQGAESSINLDDYIYDETDSSSSDLFFKMGVGTFRMVTGKIAEHNPERFKLGSPLATIGIRGTITVHDISAEGEKHGVEEIQSGKALIVQTLDGEVRQIASSRYIVDISRFGLAGPVRPMSEPELEFFRSIAPEAIEFEQGLQEGLAIAFQGDGFGDDFSETISDPAVFHHEGSTWESVSGMTIGGAAENPSLGMSVLYIYTPDSNDFMFSVGDINESLFWVGEGRSRTNDLFDGDEDELDIVEEVDGAFYPTDPHGASSSDAGDGHIADPVEDTPDDPPVVPDDPPGNSDHTDDPPGNSDHTDDPPGNSDHTDDPPGNSDHTDDPPGNSDHTDDISWTTGTDDPDQIIGTSRVDYINGMAGDDSIDGKQGNDSILGGSGDDSIDGGNGSDSIDGGDGNDTIYGGRNEDYILGGAGDDFIHGGQDGDTIDGGAGSDTASYEGESAIQVDLSAGTVLGGSNNDTLISIENIIGTRNDDNIIGSNVANTLIGGAGDDSLTGAGGADYLSGGRGDDIFVYNSVFEGGDSIDEFVHKDDGFFFGFDFNSNYTFVSSSFDDGGYDGSLGSDVEAAFVFDSGSGEFWYDSGDNHYLIATVFGEAVEGDDITVESPA
ncbi:FecR domain-containing protein [Maridesulfovibrio sp.]|uniref:FecR domain-containing protein n=1 Tax=Maridesulfovibrio sp. TaxID=2795000 RepID=UPI0029CA19FC|nr:FecR domain-containing protein [Maridesulfovibrio sp.]